MNRKHDICSKTSQNRKGCKKVEAVTATTHFRLLVKTQALQAQHSDGFTSNTLSTVVNSIYNGVGIGGAKSHSIRPTGLTNFAEDGDGIRTYMAFVGDSNMATTQRSIDLRSAVIKAAIELF